LIALDEFALQSMPYAHYAWAKKTPSPEYRAMNCTGKDSTVF
jgi:hypothetical protein